MPILIFYLRKARRLHKAVSGAHCQIVSHYIRQRQTGDHPSIVGGRVPDDALAAALQREPHKRYVVNGDSFGVVRSSVAAVAARESVEVSQSGHRADVVLTTARHRPLCDTDGITLTKQWRPLTPSF